MTASICLFTYNGARYLKPLLDSLAGQTQLPDELLVGDDCSSDDTLEIVSSFATEAPFPVEILVNERRLGPTCNLGQLLARASGDILFPCDQDDIWAPEKIERLSWALDESPDHAAAICNSSFIDATGAPLPGSLFERVGQATLTRELVARASYDAMVQVFRHNIAASHALAVRRSALDLVLPFQPSWYADWWIALVLSATTGITVLDDCLVAYRLHDSNTVGMPLEAGRLADRTTPDMALGFAVHADMLRAAITRVCELRPEILTPPHRFVLENLAEHLRTRGELPPSRGLRVLPVLREALSGRYRQFSNGWRSAVVDVLRAADTP